MTLRTSRVALALLVLFSGLLWGAPAASAASPQDWYLTVGPSCGSNFLAKEPWCGPMLVVRDPSLPTEDRLKWPSNSLTGPNGPVPLQLDSRAYDTYWGGFPPATDYRGQAYYNYTPSGLAPGRYTYALTVDISGEWSCSKYNREGCTWLESDRLKYEWTFDWDGTTAVTVAPTWRLVVVPKKLCGKKGCAAVVAYGANVSMLTPIEIQRRSGKGDWKTIETDKVVGYSGWIFDDSAKPGTTYQYRLKTTDPSQQVSRGVRLRF